MTVDQSHDAPLKKPNYPSRHAHIKWKLPDTPSDLIVKVGNLSFALHKSPLVRKCGLLKMLVQEGGSSEEEAPFKVNLEGVPGGAEGFELAAKFCYGMSLDISKHNVALLRCVSEFLGMSEDEEDHENPNLLKQTEEYLDGVLMKHGSLKDIVTVLHECEALLPSSEDIVDRLVERFVAMAVDNGGDNQHAEAAAATPSPHTLITFHQFQHNMNHNIEWWVEDLSVLGIHLYQRVLSAMSRRGLRADIAGHALIYYAHKSLKNLTSKSLSTLDSSNCLNTKVHEASIAVEHEQRILVETIVSLLPREKNMVLPISFLIGMLRIGRILESTLASRLDLEKRIASQLHRATLDDLLIPSYGKDGGDSLFDVEMVHRLVSSFIEEHAGACGRLSNDDDDVSDDAYGGGFDTSSLPYRSADHPLAKVGKLVDGYLAEIAADSNLPLSKFIGLAELLPEHARPESDGLYRAIDIFMKTHGGMTDIDRKKLCKLIVFHKLTPEACTHAAQNERLPVQAVVQVLYFEQMRIRSVMAGSHYPHVDEHPSLQGHGHHQHHPLHLSPPHHQHQYSPHGHRPHHISPQGHSFSPHGAGHPLAHHHEQSLQHHSHHPEEAPRDSVQPPPFLHKISNGNLCASLSPHDQYASMRIENRELKQEVARMRMRLSDLEKGHNSMKQEKPHHCHSHPDQQYAADHGKQEHDEAHHHHGMNHHHHQHQNGGFFHAVSKSLSKLNPFHHHKLAPVQDTPPPPLGRGLEQRVKSVSRESRKDFNKTARRHSAST